jgi:response regulator of citrate/malate metabolism
MNTVLIVEDDLMVADMLEEILTDEGFVVCGIAQRITEALKLADEHNPDLAIIDVQLTDGLGTDLVPQLLRRNNEIGILYTTGNSELVRDAPGHGCLSKPFSLRDAAKSLSVVAEILQRKPATTTPPTNLVLLGCRV